MVLLGLGILVISVTFLAIKLPPWRWQRFLSYGGRSANKADRLATSTRKSSGTKDQQDVHLAPDEEPSTTSGFEIAVSEPEHDEEQDDTAAATPEARPQQENILPIPQFVLDNKAVEETATSVPKDFKESTSSLSKSRTHNDSIPSLASPSTKSAPSRSVLDVKQASKQSASNLMPPPSIKPSALRPLPKLGDSLNPPPSAASALRGPPLRSPQTSNSLSLPASSSTFPPSLRPSKKVLLDPGHSPLDWAHLIRNPPTPGYLRGEGLPQHLIKVSPGMLREHHGRKGRDAWGTYQGKVYNLTPYLKFHPGGVGELMRGAGKAGEAERLFAEIHPWVSWDGMLAECLVGILVSDNDGAQSGEQDLEAMD